MRPDISLHLLERERVPISSIVGTMSVDFIGMPQVLKSKKLLDSNGMLFTQCLPTYGHLDWLKECI